MRLGPRAIRRLAIESVGECVLVDAPGRTTTGPLSAGAAISPSLVVIAVHSRIVLKTSAITTESAALEPLRALRWPRIFAIPDGEGMDEVAVCNGRDPTTSEFFLPHPG